MLITVPPTVSTQMYINGIERVLASGTGVTWSDSEQPPSAMTVLVTGHNPIGPLEVYLRTKYFWNNYQQNFYICAIPLKIRLVYST